MCFVGGSIFVLHTFECLGFQTWVLRVGAIAQWQLAEHTWGTGFNPSSAQKDIDYAPVSWEPGSLYWSNITFLSFWNKTSDTQNEVRKGLFSSLFVEVSVHHQLTARQGTMALGQYFKVAARIKGESTSLFSFLTLYPGCPPPCSRAGVALINSPARDDDIYKVRTLPPCWVSQLNF